MIYADGCTAVTPLVQVIASVQNQLTPERVNIVWLSKRFAGECHEKERWFGTQYSHEGVEGEGSGEEGRGGERRGRGEEGVNCSVNVGHRSIVYIPVCLHLLIYCFLCLQQFPWNGKQIG